MPAALGSGQGSAGRKVCATLQTLLLLFPCPQLPAQCYLGTSEPDRPPQGPRWTSLSIPCMLLPVSSASIMDLGQHSQSLARTIWARAGGSATRSVERATEQPDPCDWWAGRGPVPSLNMDGTHFSCALGQPVSREPRGPSARSQMNSGPHLLTPDIRCVCLLWPRAGVPSFLR